MENRPTRGNGNYLGLVVMAALFFMFFSPFLRNTLSSRDTAYTKEQFAKELQEEQVERVEISPNKDNMTGYATVVRKEGDREILYATVIADIEEMAREANVMTVVHDIPVENTFLTNVLPMLLVMGICFLFFYLMSGQGMGGGNAKMMNFGKSRARLSTGEEVTFSRSPACALIGRTSSLTNAGASSALASSSGRLAHAGSTVSCLYSPPRSTAA